MVPPGPVIRATLAITATGMALHVNAGRSAGRGWALPPAFPGTGQGQGAGLLTLHSRGEVVVPDLLHQLPARDRHGTFRNPESPSQQFQITYS